MWSFVKSKAPDEAGDRALVPYQEAGTLPLPGPGVSAPRWRPLQRDTFILDGIIQLDAQPAGMGFLVGAQRIGSAAPDNLPTAHQAHVIGKTQGEVQILLNQQNG